MSAHRAGDATLGAARPRMMGRPAAGIPLARLQASGNHFNRYRPNLREPPSRFRPDSGRVADAIGFIAGRAGWIRAEATKGLSNLVFMVLTPALLFRTMSTVHVEQFNFKPVLMYFVAVCLLFAAMFVWQGGTRRAAVVMFSQRYEVAEDLVTASVAVSTGLALGTVSLVMALLARF